jgi:RimJ/RimL family protein N-acetyltransferase
MMHSREKRETVLVEVSDEDFNWMLRREPASRNGVTLAPGGVENPDVLATVRQIAQRLHEQRCRGAWMIVSGDEVVGLCSYRRPPAQGEVEIGYGVAESRRGRGHATRAVEAMVAEAAVARVHVVFAETSVANPASGRVLEKNGFVCTGTRIDAEDGEVLTWRKPLTP